LLSTANGERRDHQDDGPPKRVGIVTTASRFSAFYVESSPGFTTFTRLGGGNRMALAGEKPSAFTEYEIVKLAGAYQIFG